MHVFQNHFPYTYSQMLSDLHSLCSCFPRFARLKSIGCSVLHRPLWVLLVGDPSSNTHILIQGAIHGREYTTARLLVEQASHLLRLRSSLCQKICFHFLPMSNPDGVILSQCRRLSGLQEPIYRQDRWAGYTSASIDLYAARWKANALGVDLNRNFPAGWESLSSRLFPSSENYKGSAPLCAPESRYLALYTLENSFAATVSYHESGSEIYYESGSDIQVIQESRRLGLEISALTGYPLVSDPSLPAGGYRDWVMDALKLPSLTIEIGQGPAPLSPEEYPDILQRNRDVPEGVGRAVLKDDIAKNETPVQ